MHIVLVGPTALLDGCDRGGHRHELDLSLFDRVFAEHELRGLLLHADLRERGFVLEVQVIQRDFHTVARHVRCYRGRHRRDVFNKHFLVALEYVRQ